MLTEYDLMMSGLLGYVEVIDGEMQSLPPSSYKQNLIGQNIFHALESYSASGYLTQGYMSYVLNRQNDTIYSLRLPDVAYNRRLPALKGITQLPGAPDLAVKVIAPYNSIHTLEQFIIDFHNAGTQYVWLVYPEQEELHCYAADDMMQRYTATDTMTVEDFFPLRVELDIADFFAYPWNT